MKIRQTQLRKSISILLVVLWVLSAGFSASAVLPYNNYMYDNNGKPQATPAAYSPVKMIELNEIAGKIVKDPAHMQLVGTTIYIADTGNNRILCLDDNGKLLSVFEEFEWQGEKESFAQPSGFAVVDDGSIYIADTGNARIVRLNAEGKCIDVFLRPEAVALGENYTYRPLKIGVDSAGRMFVVAQGINRGLMELTAVGDLVGFYGAPRVTMDVLTYFWRTIATAEQKAKMQTYVPTEYNNVFVDHEDFVYATISALDEEEVETAIRAKDFSTIKMVTRLNPLGMDVLKKNGAYPPLGDLQFLTKATDTTGGAVALGPSAFTAITADEYGTYRCLDIRRGKIFSYDSDGNLMYVFGGNGNQLGAFNTPVAIGQVENRIYVLDQALCRITVFAETDYGQHLNRAVVCHATGQYEEALEQWETVARYNGNYTQAYIQMGKIYMRRKDYDTALEYLKLADEKVIASQAFAQYRNEFMAENIYTILMVVAGSSAVLAGVVWIWRRLKRERCNKN